MMMQSYLWTENGITERRWVGGRAERLNAVQRTNRKARTTQYSRANGFVGDRRRLARQMKIDAALNVPIRYVPTAKAVTVDGRESFAWRAEFESRAQKNKWLRAHRRVDHDACYSDPAPGDFIS